MASTNKTDKLKLNKWLGTDKIQRVDFNNDNDIIEQEFLDRGINVLWYGADPTGVNDSSTAIQNAINLLSNGGRIYIPKGTYLINTTINLNTNNVGIKGEGSATVLKANSSLTNVISMTSTTAYGNRGAEIKNFLIDCNSLAQTGLYIGATSTGTIVQRNFHNIKIQKALNYGLVLDACQNNLFTLLSLDDNAGHIKFVNGAGNNTFISCFLNKGSLSQILSTQDNTLSSWTLNLFNNVPQANLFEGCVIERATSNHCVKLTYSKNITFKRCEFESGGITVSAIQTDSTTSTYTYIDTCRFAGTNTTVPAIINNGYSMFVGNSHFENYPNPEIQTGNKLQIHNNWSNNGKIRIQNTAGNIADNIKFNDVPTYLGTNAVSSVTTYPSEFLYDDYDNVYFKTKNKNIQVSNITSGTTAQRPTNGLVVGYPYFDTTLGKPIWYNGSVWKDSAGATV